MRITAAQIAQPVRYPGSHGDLWTTTWADDGNLYSASNDTQGFDQACSSNLALNRLRGSDPLKLEAETINPMSNYGYWGEVLSTDHAFWKANGLASLDGVLYLTVSRQSGYMDSGMPYQEAFDASIISSADHGSTWSTPPALEAAMFPGQSFATPFFVDYGQDGRDAVDEFVYAVSTDGAWNNGNALRLGRVPRDRIGRLAASDWEFIQDFDAEADFVPVWGARHDTARSIFRAPGRTSMTGIHYIKQLGLYVMPQWHYPDLGEPGKSWNRTSWELYQSPTPWGPWQLFHTQEWSPGAFYNPCIISKFTNEEGTALWIFAAGTFEDCMLLDGYYGLYLFRVSLTVDQNSDIDISLPPELVRERELMFEFKRHAEHA